MSEIDKWLEINTFECPMGRISPETCQKLRQRPTVSDLMNGKAGGTTHLRPTPCINCTDWERLAQEVYEKRKKFQEEIAKQKEEKQEVKMAETKRIIVCPECGQKKPYYARGLCHTCYDRLRKRGELPPLKKTKKIKESMEQNKKNSTTNELIVLVDFSIVPEVLEELKERAKEELRDLSMQILWELKLSQKIKQELKEKENKQCS